MISRLQSGPRRQRGAALIIVLLLVATLAFILLSITTIVTAGVRRASAERARSELMWRAAAAEEIAQSILKSYVAAGLAKMTPSEGVFVDQLELPFERGIGSLIFEDATGCFNVNALVKNGATDPVEMEAFVSLLEAIAIGSGEARKLAEVVADFIDDDATSQGMGAEDGFYTGLPTPYRTAGGPIASVSELRAMDGVSRELYGRMRPYLCALNADTQPEININFAREGHAPLLFARIDKEKSVSLADIRAAIAAMPPGGVTDASTLDPALAAVPRLAVNSALIRARIRLELNDRSMEETLLFQTGSASGGEGPKLIARAFGDAF